MTGDRLGASGLAYVGFPLNRAAHRRSDGDFLAAAMARSDTRIALIAGEQVALRNNAAGYDPWFSPEEAHEIGVEIGPLWLGLAGESACFAARPRSDSVERRKQRGDLLLIDLRSIAVQGLIGPDALQAIAAGKALLAWHARNGFCANCGAASRIAEGGWRRDCACGAQHFPRTDPCVIMLAVDGERCLLGRAHRFVPGMWSCLAGFVEPGENIEDAVRRETLEEAGIRVGEVRYFGSQPWPFPMSLMVGCHARALDASLKIDPDEIEDARWVTRQEAGSMLARTHPDGLITPPPAAIAHHIIRAFVERGPALFAARG